MSRRALVLAAVGALAACDAPAFREAEVSLAPRAAPAAAPGAAGGPRPLRFSVAAVESPRDTYAAYARLFARVGAQLGTDVEFVQRRTYREVNELLLTGGLDAALVCTGGYLELKRAAPGRVEVVAVPVAHGTPTYEALVIVPMDDPARTLADLRGRRFAYTDDLSFSGHAYVVRMLRDAHEDPTRFFGSTLYTQNHDRSIRAVASGVVDGAAVHSLVYARLLQDDPALARQVRVLHRSAPFGGMPVVASPRLDRETRERLQAVLLRLAADPEAAAALATVGIERFAPAPAHLFDSAERVMDGLP